MIKKLIEELKKDENYYYSWQSNIAMAFKDEYHRAEEKTDIHTIANNAAQNFLNLLIK